MNLVRINAVSVEVPAALDGVDLALDLDLVALHHLLDLGADLSQLHVNTCDVHVYVYVLLCVWVCVCVSVCVCVWALSMCAYV